jgi:hypothetical protein
LPELRKIVQSSSAIHREARCNERLKAMPACQHPTAWNECDRRIVRR